jgi:hypothetical protein
MTGVCARCETPLSATTYTVTFTASAESSGTRLQHSVCRHCWERLREELSAEVPA